MHPDPELVRDGLDQIAGAQRGISGQQRAQENPNAAAAREAGMRSTSTRRTISYLTCTRSRGSKNCDDVN